MVAASPTPAVVYEALLKFAAQAEWLHNDDTPHASAELAAGNRGRPGPGPAHGHFRLFKERKLSDQERLALHQEPSQPVMDPLRQWMKEQLERKKVEPNSGLGEAINYLLKRWETLTRFLSVPPDPSGLDNHIAERALKTAIRHRKNSLSYKTRNGARIGDIHMSLLHTCQLHGVNPFDDYMALEQHAEAVAKAPTCWFRWNYRPAIEAADSS